MTRTEKQGTIEGITGAPGSTESSNAEMCETDLPPMCAKRLHMNRENGLLSNGNQEIELHQIHATGVPMIARGHIRIGSQQSGSELRHLQYATMHSDNHSCRNDLTSYGPLRMSLTAMLCKWPMRCLYEYA